MIDVSDVVNDPDLCSNFQILQMFGKFTPDGWTITQSTLVNTFGAVRNMSGKDLEMIPEADRVREAVSFRTTTALYETNETSSNRISDILIWQGNQYKILTVKNYSEQGYWLAIAHRLPQSSFIALP